MTKLLGDDKNQGRRKIETSEYLSPTLFGLTYHSVAKCFSLDSKKTHVEGPGTYGERISKKGSPAYSMGKRFQEKQGQCTCIEEPF